MSAGRPTEKSKEKSNMPLFKGTGCKSTPNKVIAYITDKRKAKIVSSQNLDDSRSYAQQFRNTARQFNKGSKYEERKYYHFKLSCDRSDSVTAENHHEYAEAMARRLFPNYECIIATHTDTDTVHSHIIVNAVSFETGRKLNIRNSEYGQMKDIANEMGAERGFTTLDFRKPALDRVSSQERLVELKGGTSWKEELREVIKLAKQDTRSMEDFEKYLNDYGVTITRNTDKTIAYKHPNKQKSIRGERLGAEYMKGAIVNELAKNRRLISKYAAASESRTKADGNREYTIESSVDRVERKMRKIVERVCSLTSDDREKQRRGEHRATEDCRRDRNECQAIKKCQRTVAEQHRKRVKGIER